METGNVKNHLGQKVNEFLLNSYLLNFFSFIEIDKEKIDYSKENNNIKEK